MPSTQSIAVDDLSLDLRNYRITHQRSERKAIEALIAANPLWFWELMRSLLSDGYHITENVLVLKASSEKLIVKEGNRRVSALKLALKLVPGVETQLPSDIQKTIESLDRGWKKRNSQVPCAVYEASEAKDVDRIITLTHGKGQQAGRDVWSAVARARHNRDALGGSEPALDLLESYLKHGKNLTPLQQNRWGADYPVSVLQDAITRLAPRISDVTAKDLPALYPAKIRQRDDFERVLMDIGEKQLGFDDVRGKFGDVLATKYNFPAPKDPNSSTNGAQSKKAANSGSTSTSNASQSSATKPAKKTSHANDDPKNVAQLLKNFHPRGNNRSKVVALVEEAICLKLHRTPHAFCFLLRSMFEISAKAYCDDHARSGGPKMKDLQGKDIPLWKVLESIYNHLTDNEQNKDEAKRLLPAMTELKRKFGFFSVTSLNQLIHHENFSVKEADISLMFAHVFPLLEAMNS